MIMRTFSEYILEAKQSYIFGGTDNRNTQDTKTGTPFIDLKEGDKFYWFVYDDQGDNTYSEIEFCDVYAKPYIENNNFCFMSNYGSFEIPLKYAKEPAFAYKNDRLTYYGATTCTGIIDVLSYDNIIPRNFDEIEKASLKESNQNYIFGGTDDRNTEIGKTFGELEDGDTFYWFSKSALKAWKLTLSKITKNNNETQVFFHYYYYDDKNKKKIDYCMMPVDEDIHNLTSYLDKNEYFAVAVDETEFLKIVQNYDIYKEDIIDETVK